MNFPCQNPKRKMPNIAVIVFSKLRNLGMASSRMLLPAGIGSEQQLRDTRRQNLAA